MTTTQTTAAARIAEARAKLAAKLEARTTDQLMVTLVQLYAMPESRESVIIASYASEIVARREGVEDLMWEVEADTYLDAILLALATRDAAAA